ncbi:MAG: cysteine hydrolase [Deltaproteobacteria bacterium]|jgi:nicotinamidase-related amidase|nr:cysteine hydrolase [Deltaproteobacteria bacterium]
MKALLLIDIQNDYFPGGRMELHHSEAAGEKASELLEAFRNANLPIFHVQHIASPNASFFLPGTDGAHIHMLVTPLAGEPVIVKHYPSSFRETDLLEQLRAAGITELVIVGMMTHMCVDTTVRAAHDLSFACTLAGDACATKSLAFDGRSVTAQDVQTVYLAALHGTFAEVTDVNTIVAGL